MLGALRAAFRLDSFASESLLETPEVGRCASTGHLISLPRVCRELWVGGAERPAGRGEIEVKRPIARGRVGERCMVVGAPILSAPKGDT